LIKLVGGKQLVATYVNIKEAYYKDKSSNYIVTYAWNGYYIFYNNFIRSWRDNLLIYYIYIYIVKVAVVVKDD